MLCQLLFMARGGKRIPFGQQTVWNGHRSHIVSYVVIRTFKATLRRAGAASEHSIDIAIKASARTRIARARSS